jgi:hypothetical protein
MTGHLTCSRFNRCIFGAVSMLVLAWAVILAWPDGWWFSLSKPITSPPLVIIRMHPLVRRDLALHRQLDQMHPWRIARRPA